MPPQPAPKNAAAAVAAARPKAGSKPVPPPSPAQLLEDARNALVLCETGMSAYQSLMRVLNPPPDDQRPERAPRLTWEAGSPGGPRTVQVVTDLAKLQPEDRDAVLAPLCNIHFDQMMAGASQAQKAIGQLVAILDESQRQASGPTQDEPEVVEPDEEADDDDAQEEE